MPSGVTMPAPLWMARKPSSHRLCMMACTSATQTYSRAPPAIQASNCPSASGIDSALTPTPNTLTRSGHGCRRAGEKRRASLTAVIRVASAVRGPCWRRGGPASSPPMRPRRSAPHAPRILGVLLALVPSIAAAVEAVDRENRACLETALSGVTWRGTNQLYCLKPDPRRTRRDPFGRCQERHYEVTLKNSCAFLIEVRWRFENETASRYRT